MENSDMTDYLRLAESMDRAVSEIMASVFEPNPQEPHLLTCDPARFSIALMRLARASEWAKGLHKSQVG